MIERERLIKEVTALQRNQDVSDSFLEEIRDDLYYYILKIVNDSSLAEDLTQDTLVVILEKINDLQEPAAFVSWSKKIAYHKCSDYFKVRHDILLDEFEDGTTIFDTLEEDRGEFLPEETVEQEALKKDVHDMIMELPEDQRSAILLRYFDEMSLKEISEIHGVSEGTVKSRLNYARKALKKAVENYEKKNGIKLHCVGVVPLLLWLFRQYRLSAKISLTEPHVSQKFFGEAAKQGTAAAWASGSASAGSMAAATADSTATTAAAAASAAGTGIAGLLGVKWIIGLIIGVVIVVIGILLPIVGTDPAPSETTAPVVTPTEEKDPGTQAPGETVPETTETEEPTQPTEETETGEDETSAPTEEETPEMPTEPDPTETDPTEPDPTESSEPGEDETPEMPIPDPTEDETPEMPVDPTEPDPTEPDTTEPSEPGEDETPEMPIPDPTEDETPEMPV